MKLTKKLKLIGSIGGVTTYQIKKDKLIYISLENIFYKQGDEFIYKNK